MVEVVVVVVVCLRSDQQPEIKPVSRQQCWCLGREEPRWCQGQRVGGGGFEDIKLGASQMHGQLLLHGCRCGGCDVGMGRLEQVHPRSVMDQVRGVWTIQDRTTRGAHQGQWVGDGGHGLTEPEPEPKRAIIRQQGICGCKAAAVAQRRRLHSGGGCTAAAVAQRAMVAGMSRGNWREGDGES